MPKKIRILIVDDSALFRAMVSRGVAEDPEIEIVGQAGDPFEAREKIIQFDPDVMVCDVVMPKMDGIEFIRRLLPQYPLRVVVVSSLSDKVLDAMNAGAVDFVAKPDMSAGRTREAFMAEMISKIKIAASANISAGRVVSTASAVSSNVVSVSSSASSKKIIAIGASTGGTEAIFSVLKSLPANSPGIVIVQHIPPVFSRMFAERLDKSTLLKVKEAQTGDIVEKGQVLIAPGDAHMKLVKVGPMLKVEVFKGEKVNGHCPSVDVLFESVATVCGADAVGVILTGMGNDGARGLLSMRKRGARTVGQDEKSCVVYGMPRVAYELGAVEKQVALSAVPQAISAAIS